MTGVVLAADAEEAAVEQAHGAGEDVLAAHVVARHLALDVLAQRGQARGRTRPSPRTSPGRGARASAGGRGTACGPGRPCRSPGCGRGVRADPDVLPGRRDDELAGSARGPRGSSTRSPSRRRTRSRGRAAPARPGAVQSARRRRGVGLDRVAAVATRAGRARRRPSAGAGPPERARRRGCAPAAGTGPVVSMPCSRAGRGRPRARRPGRGERRGRSRRSSSISAPGTRRRTPAPSSAALLRIVSAPPSPRCGRPPPARPRSADRAARILDVQAELPRLDAVDLGRRVAVAGRAGRRSRASALRGDERAAALRGRHAERDLVAADAEAVRAIDLAELRNLLEELNAAL